MNRLLLVNTYNRGLDTNNGRLIDHGRRAALLALVLVTTMNCTAPAANQGQGQGGSVGPTTPITVTVNIGSGHGEVTVADKPTAAPAATSAASASQTATTDTRPAVGTDAIKAIGDAVNPAAGALGTVIEPAKKKDPAPVEPK